MSVYLTKRTLNLSKILMCNILGQDSNIFRRDLLYGIFQVSSGWFPVEFDELYRFHYLSFALDLSFMEKIQN